MRISDWSSDVCSSDLAPPHNKATSRPVVRRFAAALAWLPHRSAPARHPAPESAPIRKKRRSIQYWLRQAAPRASIIPAGSEPAANLRAAGSRGPETPADKRSEEHTSELQSLMRNSYAVFCLKKKNQ